MIKLTCPTCATEYVRKHGRQKYCTAECRPADKKIQGVCVACGVQVERAQSGTPRTHGFTCSPECHAEVTGLKRKCSLPPDHWVFWIGKSSAWPRYGWKQCECCAKDFPANGPTAKYCSKICSWRQKERDRGARSYSEIAAEIRSCARCNAGYSSPHIHRVHCSDLCRELHRKERGVALYHGWISKAERIALYERDNYTCWLCNEPCDITADPQRDDWAPTLDHVITRSQGGTHDHDNLRTAHRWCNAVRSDGSPERAMALLGAV